MLRSAVTDQHEKIGSTAEVEQRLFAKIAWRFVPILTLGFLLNHLDRNNIGFAALQMNQRIGLTATQFGFGAGILFLGYCFFELPSNLLLYRVGARVWLSRIMITWGLASAAMIFVTGPKSWYVLRFVLGTAELLALVRVDNRGARRHQRSAVRFLGHSNTVSHRHRLRRRPRFHQRRGNGRRFFRTFYYGMA